MQCIMIQSTMSNAGKSFIVAGLCRVFSQDGFKTAPFKSQNMALNSFVTREGLEMGRAQAVQAEAAGIEPNVHMNPILLKPSSETGSQVILQGRVAGHYTAADYFRKKKEYLGIIRESFQKLAAEYDILVLEGAGSPAEINLKKDDIVNMGIAGEFKAPVLLVGDIDRGGMFASLYGTIRLLSPRERSFIKGMIANKFRGDISILQPGLQMLEERLRQEGIPIPFVGTIPMKELDLDAEDSLSERLRTEQEKRELDIAVVCLPHISNFTDFHPLEGISDVSLRYVKTPEALDGAHCILLPGTKNTMKDLEWLFKTGFSAAIRERARAGVPVMGICGGMQMLGESVEDPYGTEAFGRLEGLGLLRIKTRLEKEKVLGRSLAYCRAEVPFLPLSEEEGIKGYEIHMGSSEGTERRLFRLSDGRPEGFIDASGRVFGSYLHGLFDNASFLAAFLHRMEEERGLPRRQRLLRNRDRIREESYDRLAALLRESLDMERIYRILREGIA